MGNKSCRERSLPLPACGERSDCLGDAKASSGAIRVRGYRAHFIFMNLRMQPLTPTLSPQERGEGVQLRPPDAVL
jgi:hypothetical protein